MMVVFCERLQTILGFNPAAGVSISLVNLAFQVNKSSVIYWIVSVVIYDILYIQIFLQPMMFANLSSKLILCQKSFHFRSTDPETVLSALAAISTSYKPIFIERKFKHI